MPLRYGMDDVRIDLPAAVDEGGQEGRRDLCQASQSDLFEAPCLTQCFQTLGKCQETPPVFISPRL